MWLEVSDKRIQSIGEGEIGDKIAERSWGQIYSLPTGWELPYVNQAIPAVAMLLYDTAKAYSIVDNLRAVDELVFHGYTRHGKGTMWAIVKGKPAHSKSLRDLRSFKLHVGQNETCPTYMKTIRKAIVKANSEYFQMHGSPIHGFVHLSISRPLITFCSLHALTT